MGARAIEYRPSPVASVAMRSYMSTWQAVSALGHIAIHRWPGYSERRGSKITAIGESLVLWIFGATILGVILAVLVSVLGKAIWRAGWEAWIHLTAYWSAAFMIAWITPSRFGEIPARFLIGWLLGILGLFVSSLVVSKGNR